MLKDKDDNIMCISEEVQNVQLRKGVRFDHGIEKSAELERAERKIKHQSISFMHTHVLVSYSLVVTKSTLSLQIQFMLIIIMELQ